MKQTENKEIDLLLRSMARRQGGRLLASEDRSAEHLDADEMTSYAEQVLPPAARARYTSHLAECAGCRKIVSELTAAYGVSYSEPSVSQKSPSGIRQKLAELFSPRFFRYAVPALAILAFIAVGLVALRQPRQAEFVAQNQRSSSGDGPIETNRPSSPQESQNSGLVAERRISDSKKPVEDNGNKHERTDGKIETSDAPTTTDSLSASDRDASPGKSTGGIAQPSYAPEPTAPPPKAQAAEVESRSEVLARQKKEADNNKDEQAQAGSRSRADNGQSDVAASSARRPEQPAVQREEKARPADRAKLASGVGAKANEDESDTRTLYGRRFRRQGGIWIDTAFQSSTSITVVTRGSERFRSLVADEPEIRAIAAQLSGEVILVWKGRAYRIR